MHFRKKLKVFSKLLNGDNNFLSTFDDFYIKSPPFPQKSTVNARLCLFTIF